MAGRVAINGFGRIGRLVFRHLMDEPSLEVVAVNDVAHLDTLVYLLRYDSVHSNPTTEIWPTRGGLKWGDREVRFTSITEPARLPWRELGVDIVIEASGRFTERDKAAEHLSAGAARVVITAPARGGVPMFCFGINENTFDPGENTIISNGSCTTYCLATMLKVLDEQFGVEAGFLTTVHAATSSQAVVDGPNKKLRRGRSALLGIIPTTTGAATSVGEVLPRLSGKITGLAMRVPVADGSISDLVFHSARPVSVESINDAFRAAATGDPLKGLLGITDEELVSTDIVGTTWSALVDAQSTMVLRDRMGKVLGWYDNEWAYARRVVDLTAYVAGKTG